MAGFQTFGRGRISAFGNNLFKTDLSEATVATLFLSQTINARLQPKLLRELKPGARVVSHRFEMPRDWKPDQDISVGGIHVISGVMRFVLVALGVAQVQADNGSNRRENADGDEEEGKHPRSNPKAMPTSRHGPATRR